MDINSIFTIAKKNNLPKKDLVTISEYLEHREWGLSYEVLCSSILSNNIIISKNDYSIIIGKDLKMDSNLWESIEHLKAPRHQQ